MIGGGRRLILTCSKDLVRMGREDCYLSCIARRNDVLAGGRPAAVPLS